VGIQDPTRYYTGLTTDVRTRLETHNSGGSQHTAPLRPWKLVASIEFHDKVSAMHLKST
jgi:putative endonuclease